MEVTVKVELGPATLELIKSLTRISAKTEPVKVEAGPAKAEPEPVKVEPETEPVPEEKPKPTRSRRSPARKETPKETPKEPGFEDLDDEAKLEAIKTEVTKHAKKGKSADIKTLLLFFEASRASELAPDQYDKFYQAIKRYGAGESLDSIVEEDLA